MKELWRKYEEIWRKYEEIFPSSRAQEEAWNFSKSQSITWNSEFFYVLGIWKNMEKIWRNMKEYEGIMKDSEEIWRKYEEIWINMWKYENKDSPYIWAMGLGKHRRHSSSQNYWLFPLLIRFVPFLIIIKNFLGKPNNKDHVSCFSIWGGGSRNFSKSQSLYRGRKRLPLWAYVLSAHGSCRDLPKRSHFRGVLLEVYKESLGLIWRKQKSNSSQQAVIEGGGRSKFV